ncbi:ATP-binding protein [Nanoarchaeota archaeon]
MIISAMLFMVLFSSIVNADYEIFPKEISEKLRTYEILEERVSIKNNDAVPITGFVALEGNISDVLTLENKSATIAPGEEVDINFRFFDKGAEENKYEGMLVITGDLQEKVPLTFETYEGDRVRAASLIIDVSLLQPIVVRGDTLKFKIDVVNLLSERAHIVEMDLSVHRLLGNELSDYVVYQEDVTVSVERIHSDVKSVDIPEELEIGDYILRIKAEYSNQTSTTDTLFSVKQRFYEQDMFGLVPVWLLSVFMTLFSTAYLSIRIYKKHTRARKRFHAEVEYDLLPRPGDGSLFIGNIAETNKKAFVDMDKLTVHSIVAGSTGGGKSIAAQDIVEEALLNGVAVAVFDPTAQWSGMLRKLEDAKFLEFYSKFGMNPKKDPRGFNGNIKAVKNGREIINIFKYMKPGEIQVFTTSTLDPKDYDVFVASMIQQIFHSDVEEYRGLKYLLVFDEIHRILPKFGGSGAGFTQIERGCREFRKWGIGIVLISQVLSDFVGEIKANINTQVQMKTRDEGDLNRIKMQYGEEYVQSLVKSPVGSGMIQNSGWNRGRPYYVTFRPILHSVVRLTDEELDKYNKFNEVVEQMEYELDQLEEVQQDVFDLRLELKLAKDKIKTGNFNMVQIYTDGLLPRVQKMWDKLGKKPKKLELKLLDKAEMEKELAEARAERAKKDPAETQEAPAAEPEKKEEMTPERMNELEEEITQLVDQVDTALERWDKESANELYNEIMAIVERFPKDRKHEWLLKLDELKKKIEG